jgi:hypothetical protein
MRSRATKHTSPPPPIWIYGRHLLRRHVSATIASSAVGKTSLKIVEALALATGRNLLGQEVPTLVSGSSTLKDDKDEIDRRMVAAMMYCKIKPELRAISLSKAKRRRSSRQRIATAQRFASLSSADLLTRSNVARVGLRAGTTAARGVAIDLVVACSHFADCLQDSQPPIPTFAGGGYLSVIGPSATEESTRMAESKSA